MRLERVFQRGAEDARLDGGGHGDLVHAHDLGQPTEVQAHEGAIGLPCGHLQAARHGRAGIVGERTDEEIGVRLGPDAVLGVLDDYATRSGYVITPVVVWGGPEVEIVPHPGEVLAAYRIGLHELSRDDSPRFVTIPESDRPVVQVPLGGDLIHAPTGAVLVQFRWVALDGRLGARVDEFEQPVFAWK